MFGCKNSICHYEFRRFENLGVPVLFGGHSLPSLDEIGLTDLPISGGAMAWPDETMVGGKRS